MKSILLFETEQPRIKSFAFLVKLAGLSMTVARSLEECLNWIQLHPMMDEPFSLLVINSHEATSHELKQLVDSAQEKGLPAVNVVHGSSRLGGTLPLDGLNSCNSLNLQAYLERISTSS